MVSVIIYILGVTLSTSIVQVLEGQEKALNLICLRASFIVRIAVKVLQRNRTSRRYIDI